MTEQDKDIHIIQLINKIRKRDDIIRNILAQMESFYNSLTEYDCKLSTEVAKEVKEIYNQHININIENVNKILKQEAP